MHTKIHRVMSTLSTVSIASSADVKTEIIVLVTLDIDECAANGTDLCSINAFCMDTVGSYNCTCYSGYTGDGVFCEGMQLASATTMEYLIKGQFWDQTIFHPLRGCPFVGS